MIISIYFRINLNIKTPYIIHALAYYHRDHVSNFLIMNHTVA